MASQPHTELTHSPGGPAITLRGKDSKLTFSLRDLVCEPIYAAANAPQKRTLREWLESAGSGRDGSRDPAAQQTAQATLAAINAPP